MKDGSFGMVNETPPSLCTIIDEQDSLLKSTVSPLAAIIVKESESVAKANVLTTMESEVEVLVTSSDIKLKSQVQITCIHVQILERSKLNTQLG
jgi:hypothetical protein